MVQFARIADRRSQGVSRDVLHAKEAALLYVKAQQSGSISPENTAMLSHADIVAAIGSAWEKKLHKFIISRTEDSCTLQAEPLATLAKSPVTPWELASVIAAYFKGATRVLNFINGRLRNPDLDQNIAIPEAFLESRLGLMWKERLQAAGVAYA